MAEICGGEPGPGRLAVRIDILRKEPGIGMVSHGAVVMNAALGVLRAYVSFWVGERELFGHEVLLHSLSVQGWAKDVEALVRGEMEDSSEIHFGVESPELMMTVRRHESTSGGEPFYELLVVLDSGILNPEEGLTGEGPAMYLGPKPEEILQFARELRAEADNMLLPKMFRKKKRDVK